MYFIVLCLQFPFWCPGGDSNPHALRRYHLKVVSLPISPPGHCASKKLGSLGGTYLFYSLFSVTPASPVVKSGIAHTLPLFTSCTRWSMKNPRVDFILKCLSSVMPLYTDRASASAATFAFAALFSLLTVSLVARDPISMSLVRRNCRRASRATLSRMK